AADPGGGQPAGRAGPLPGQPDVGGEVAGQVELGVAGDDDPGPPVGGGWVTQLRAGPAEHLLDEPERVFKIKSSQERLPGAVHLGGGGLGAGGPQPQRFWAAVTRQVVDGQPDEGALDDRQRAVVALPAAAAGQLLVQPAPGHRPCSAVPGGLGAGGYRRDGPG